MNATQLIDLYRKLEAHVAGSFRIFEEFPLNKEFFVQDVGMVRLVDYCLSYDFEAYSTPVWMVFGIEGDLYKIDGYADSYGNSSWEFSGGFRKVEKNTKGVITYD